MNLKFNIMATVFDLESKIAKYHARQYHKWARRAVQRQKKISRYLEGGDDNVT